MNPQLQTLLAKVNHLQAARAANHDGERPICSLLEASHQTRLAALQRQISRLSTPGRVAGSEETPTSIRPDSHRGESRVPVGNTLCQ
ncbi:MAG: hypothetical protein LLG20_22815 [Acidobacteriales bacterium]|nr:hypothetical protein [Terriglobales bacterium]